MKRLKIWLFVSLFAIITVISIPAKAANTQQSVRLPIIMYHQLLKDPEGWNGFAVSPDTLRGDLELLKENGYTSVTVEMLIKYSRGECTLPEKPVLITFDDGYESFREYGLPIFKELNMHAVLSIVGKYADTYTETPDHNILYSYFDWDSLRQLEEMPEVELASHTYDLHSTSGRNGCKIKCNESSGDYKMMLNSDLEKLENRFEEYIGITPIAFAYPFGSFCDDALDVLDTRGYKLVMTCSEEVNYLTGDPEELMHLGRFNRSNNISRQEFFAKIDS